MATFHITSPDGGTYEVNAPDNASQDDVMAYAQQNFGKQPQAPKPQLKDDLGHQAAAGVLAFGQGGLPVFDELGAAAGAGMEKLGINTLAGKVGSDGESFGDIYDKRLANIRGVENSFGDQHPIIDPALRVAGGVASMAALPAGAAAKMAARPILSGASYGAAQGFAGGEGGFGSRAIGAGVGAGLGGGSAYVVDRALSPLVSRILNGAPVVKNREIGNIAKNLELGDISPQQFAENLRSSTPDDFAGELGGENLRMLTANQAKINSPGMATARQAMRDRLSNAPQRTQQIIESTLKPTQNVENMLGNLDEIGDKLPGLYSDAGSQVVPKDVIGAQLNTPAGQAAIKDTATKLANQGIDPAKAGFIQGEDGAWSLADNVPVDTLHQFSMSLGDQVKRNPITGKVEDSNSGAIENLRKAVTSALSGASPEFEKANMNAAAKLQGQDAFNMGRKQAVNASAGTAEDIADRASTVFSPNELSYQKAGFTQGLIDAIKNSPIGTGNPAAKIAQTKVIDRLAQVTDQSTAQDFSDKIMKEKLRMELANRGINNSTTPDLLGQVIPDLPVSPIGMKFNMVNHLKDKAENLLHSGSNKRLAEALYSTSPQQKAQLARAILMHSGSPVQNMDSGTIANFLRSLGQQAPLIPSMTYNAMVQQ